MGSYRRAWEPSPAAIATSRRGVRPIRLRLARQSGAPDREDPGNDPPRCGKCAVTINGRLDGATHSPVPRMWMAPFVEPFYKLPAVSQGGGKRESGKAGQVRY